MAASHVRAFCMVSIFVRQRTILALKFSSESRSHRYCSNRFAHGS